MKLRWNAPVILTFSCAAVIIYLIDFVTHIGFIQTLFSLPTVLDLGSPLTIIRLTTYPLGHASWGHLSANLMFLMLIGPIVEEKYGSLHLLMMFVVCAVITGALNIFFFSSSILGASGIVFMLIVLASMTNIAKGEVPMTFALVVPLYLIHEFTAALKPDLVSQFAHILGGACGAVFGFLYARIRSR